LRERSFVLFVLFITQARRDRAVGAQPASEVKTLIRNTGKTPKAAYKNMEFAREE
jgi:hypothetical protein